jgi:hypothetical protein
VPSASPPEVCVNDSTGFVEMVFTYEFLLSKNRVLFYLFEHY